MSIRRVQTPQPKKKIFYLAHQIAGMARSPQVPRYGVLAQFAGTRRTDDFPCKNPLVLLFVFDLPVSTRFKVLHKSDRAGRECKNTNKTATKC